MLLPYKEACDLVHAVRARLRGNGGAIRVHRQKMLQGEHYVHLSSTTTYKLAGLRDIAGLDAAIAEVSAPPAAAPTASAFDYDYGYDDSPEPSPDAVEAGVETEHDRWLSDACVLALAWDTLAYRLGPGHSTLDMMRQIEASHGLADPLRRARELAR